MVDNTEFEFVVIQHTTDVNRAWEAVAWCRTNFDSEYITWSYLLNRVSGRNGHYKITFRFLEESDAVMFKLKFG